MHGGILKSHSPIHNLYLSKDAVSRKNVKAIRSVMFSQLNRGGGGFLNVKVFLRNFFQEWGHTVSVEGQVFLSSLSIEASLNECMCLHVFTCTCV